MEKVQIIPPPKEVDPRILTWKGAAVLGKMDSISELWVTLSDWVSPIFFVSLSRISPLYTINRICSVYGLLRSVAFTFET
jgi:hypothetical protein